MRRPFFRPLRSTFRFKKGSRLGDRDLLRAWSRFNTEVIRALPPETDVKEATRVNDARQRVLALRDALEQKEAAE